LSPLASSSPADSGDSGLFEEDGDWASEPDDDGEPADGPDGEEPEEEGESVEEFDESVSDGSANTTPGVVATATPIPKATAKPPTRPTYLA
jgi:hypothetical protein